MKQLIKSETLKLFTTKTWLWLLAGMIFLAGPGVLLAGQASVEHLSKPLHEQVWFFATAALTRLLVLILGIRSVTDEFRHGTMVPSVLTAPKRWKILASKAVVVGAAGIVFTVVAQAAMLGTAFALIGAKGAVFTVTADTVAALGGMAAAGGAWAVLGAGLGAMLRRQVIAVVASLLWLMPGGGIEDVIRGQFEAVGRWLPGNQGLALALGPGDAPWAVAIVAAYTALALAGGIALMRSRDV